MLRKRTLTAERQKSADVANDIDQSLPFSKRLLRRVGFTHLTSF